MVFGYHKHSRRKRADLSLKQCSYVVRTWFQIGLNCLPLLLFLFSLPHCSIVYLQQLSGQPSICMLPTCCSGRRVYCLFVLYTFLSFSASCREGEVIVVVATGSCCDIVSFHPLHVITSTFCRLRLNSDATILTVKLQRT